MGGFRLQNQLDQVSQDPLVHQAQGGQRTPGRKVLPACTVLSLGLMEPLQMPPLHPLQASSVLLSEFLALPALPAPFPSWSQGSQEAPGAGSKWLFPEARLCMEGHVLEGSQVGWPVQTESVGQAPRAAGRPAAAEPSPGR